MKKKLLSLLLLAALVFGLSASLFGCQKDGAHTHAFPSEWHQSNTEHWRSCAVSTCNEVLAKSAHSFDAGSLTTPPSPDGDGVKTYLCTTCGFARTEKVPYVKPNTVTESEWWSALDEITFQNITAILQITLVQDGVTQTQTLRVECTPYWAKESLLTDGGWVALDLSRNEGDNVGTGLLMTFFSPYYGLYDFFLYTPEDDSYHYLPEDDQRVTLTFENERLAHATFCEVSGENSLTTVITLSGYGDTAVAPPTAVSESGFRTAISPQAFANVTLDTVRLLLGLECERNLYLCQNEGCFSLYDGEEIALSELALFKILFALSERYDDFSLDEAENCYRAGGISLDLDDDSVYLVEASLRFDEGRLCDATLTTDSGDTYYLIAYDHGQTEPTAPQDCAHVWIESAKQIICRFCLTPASDFTPPEDAERFEMQMPLSNSTATVLLYPEFSLIAIGSFFYPVLSLGGDIISIPGFGILRRIDADSMTLSDDLTSIYEIMASCEAELADGRTLCADFYETGFASLSYTDAQGEVERVYGSFVVCGNTLVCETENGPIFFILSEDGSVYPY